MRSTKRGEMLAPPCCSRKTIALMPRFRASVRYCVIGRIFQAGCTSRLGHLESVASHDRVEAAGFLRLVDAAGAKSGSSLEFSSVNPAEVTAVFYPGGRED
jgi:hypothetical protein